MSQRKIRGASCFPESHMGPRSSHPTALAATRAHAHTQEKEGAGMVGRELLKANTPKHGVHGDWLGLGPGLAIVGLGQSAGVWHVIW